MTDPPGGILPPLLARALPAFGSKCVRQPCRPHCNLALRVAIVAPGPTVAVFTLPGSAWRAALRPTT
eukprot:6794634-Pyramimonas_sp.AAC.1